MRLGDRCKGCVVRESVAMLMDAGESRDELSVLRARFGGKVVRGHS